MKKIVCIISIIALLVLNYGTVVFAETTENQSNPPTDEPIIDYKNALDYEVANASITVESVEYFGAWYLNYYEFYSAFRKGMEILYDDNATETQYKEALCNLSDAASKLVSVSGLSSKHSGEPLVAIEAFKVKMAEKFYDYCGGNKIDWDSGNIPKYNNQIRFYDYKMVDDIVYFSAVACWYAPGAMEQIETFGKWRVYSPAVNHPSELSLYVIIDDNVYSIEEAWEKGLVTDLTPIEDFSKYTKVSRVENTEGEQPTSVNSTEPTQPISDTPTEPITDQPSKPTTIAPTEPNSANSNTSSTASVVTKKKANTIKVTVKPKTVNLKKLKSEKQIIKPLTIKDAKGTTKVTLVKSGTSKEIRKKVSVSKKGVFTFKKGKYTKGTYKIKVKIAAKGNSKYKSKTINKTVKIKIVI
ncbi:MAG: hypothetical protein VZQ55_02850 [Ruminococcus sp.]|nr:hypothetical protein [Ruminococcus sp.]